MSKLISVPKLNLAPVAAPEIEWRGESSQHLCLYWIETGVLVDSETTLTPHAVPELVLTSGESLCRNCLYGRYLALALADRFDRLNQDEWKRLALSYPIRGVENPEWQD